jgi:hypothetical protein
MSLGGKSNRIKSSGAKRKELLLDHGGATASRGAFLCRSHFQSGVEGLEGGSA